MREQEIIKNNMRKNIGINFVVFLIIFLIFDFIIYNQVFHSSYNSIDEELYRSSQRYQQKSIKPMPRNVDETEIEIEIETDKNINPRIITITRNNEGEVINGENLGRIYDEFGNEISFDKNNLNNIYQIQLSGKYSYRGINYKTTQNGEEVYVQLLANVDGEKQTLDNITNILIVGTIALLAISLIASYILAKRVMKPIIENYKKQTEFVQNASHELRTPLTIIQAQQELLLKNPNSKIIDKSENINQTLKETKRITKLIKELMDLARADSNNIKLEKTDISINELIKEIILPYQEYAKLQDKTINLELNYGKNVKVDKNKISELLVILLDNAIKYTNKKDTITIKTYAKEGKLNIEVADTGIGISKEALPHIFERFYRGDKSHSKQIEGMGLGLSIAGTIVDMHNGTIKVRNNEPKGTIF